MEIKKIIEHIEKLDGINARITNSWTGEDGFLDVSITCDDGIQREDD